MAAISSASEMTTYFTPLAGNCQDCSDSEITFRREAGAAQYKENVFSSGHVHVYRVVENSPARLLEWEQRVELV